MSSQLSTQQSTQRLKTNEKCRVQPPPPCTVLPSVWPPINHHLNAVYAPFKRPPLSIMQLHPVKAPTRAKNSPKTRPNARLSTPFTLFSFLCAPPLPLLSLSPVLSPSRPSICPPRPVETPTHEKAGKSSPVATFARSQFNQIKPRLVQNSPQIKRFPKQN